MIAKLICSRHKPGQQTVVFNESIPKVLESIPITEVRNLGGKLGRALMGKFDIKVCIYFEFQVDEVVFGCFEKFIVFVSKKVQTIGELSRISMSDLSECFPGQAKWVYNIVRGMIFATISLFFENSLFSKYSHILSHER